MWKVRSADDVKSMCSGGTDFGGDTRFSTDGPPQKSFQEPFCQVTSDDIGEGEEDKFGPDGKEETPARALTNQLLLG